MFTTTCPGCESSLNAPDTLKGKKVKCKKCGEPFVARPAGESRPKTVADIDEPTEVAPPLKGKKPARRPVNDDDDTEVMEAQIVDDEDDEEPLPKPKKKKGKGKRKKKAGSPVMLFMLIGVGALVVLGGGAIGAYYGFIKEDKKTETAQGTGGSSSVGAIAGWVEFVEAEGRFRVKVPKLPGPPEIQQVPIFDGEMIEMKLYKIDAANEGYAIIYSAVPRAAAGRPADQSLDGAVNGVRNVIRGGVLKSATPITHQGFPGREAVIELPNKKEGNLIIRIIIANDRMIQLLAGGATKTANAPDVKAFFDSLKID